MTTHRHAWVCYEGVSTGRELAEAELARFHGAPAPTVTVRAFVTESEALAHAASLEIPAFVNPLESP